MNSFWLIEDYISANDFLRFDRSFQKNVKSHTCFFEIWKKNVKYVFSNTGSMNNTSEVTEQTLWRVTCQCQCQCQCNGGYR